MPEFRFPTLRAAAQNSKPNVFSLFTALLTLILLEFPVGKAVHVIVLLAILVTLGTRLIQIFGLGNTGLGVSLLFGTFVLVLPIQLLLSIGVSSPAAHWITFLGLFSLTVLTLPGNFRTGSMRFGDLRREFSFALGVALFATALRHPWLIPFVTAYFVCERISARSNLLFNGKALAISVTSLLSGAGVSLVLRPVYWWYYYQNGDASFFEAISWSLSEWGAFDHPGAAGNSLAGYHWFSYAFYGSVSHLISLGPWEALMKLGTPLNQVILASLLIPQSQTQKKQVDWITWWVVSLCVAGIGWWRVDSASFGMLAGLALIKLTAVHSRIEHPGLRPGLLFFSVALLLVMSKASTGLFIGLVLFFFVIYQITARGKPIRFHAALPFLSWISASSFAYLVFFRGGNAEDSLLRGGTGLLASASAYNAVNELLPKDGLWLALLTLLLLAKLPATRGASLYSETRQLLFIFLAICPAILVVSPLPNSHLFINPYYFYLLATTAWLVQLKSGYSAETTSEVVRIPRPYVFLALASLLISSTYRVGLNRLDLVTSRLDGKFGQVTWEIVFSELVYSHGALVALLIGLGFTLSRCRSSWRLGRISGTLLVIVSVIIGGWLDLARRTYTWGPDIYTSSEINQAPFATSDLTEVGTYVQLHTNTNVILATNDFCCRGMDWWTSMRSQLSQDSQGHTQGWSELQRNDLPGWGGDNYSASAVTRRRFVMLGLNFQTGHLNGPTPDQVNRMNLSLQFANDPTQESLDGLKGYGATGYVVNLALTEHRDWSKFSVERFRSGNFLYLELK